MFYNLLGNNFISNFVLMLFVVSRPLATFNTNLTPAPALAPALAYITKGNLTTLAQGRQVESKTSFRPMKC